jgi:hypothetical protein
MAFPIVDAPYGLKPINLIGGQVFAGSTRDLPIPYDLTTPIFYGDFVKLTRGGINRQSVTSSGAAGLVGVFLGCSYTNPVTKQKTFSQYWPGSLAAGDGMAIVTDDPDTVFKAAVCSGTTVIGSGSRALVGQNGQMINNTGNPNTGNSANAIQGFTATPATTATFPIRFIDVNRSTAVAVSATGSSSTTTITLTGTGLPSAIVAGTDVSFIAPNGQNVATGSFVTAAAAAGATSVTINQAIISSSVGSEIPAGSIIVFTQYSEMLIKINFGQHAYYAGLASA